MIKAEQSWLLLQKDQIVCWVNQILARRGLRIVCPAKDFSDGFILAQLIEILSKKKLRLPCPSVIAKSQLRIHNLLNCGAILQFLTETERLKLVGIGPEDIVDGTLNLILGLLWSVVIFYHFPRLQHSALLSWLQRQIPNEIYDLTSSWRSGTALIELILALNPNLSDVLQQFEFETALERISIAMDIAEQQMRIPISIAPEMMIDGDERVIFGYLM